MPATEAEKRAIKKWIQAQDTITMRIPKETGMKIREAAQDAGMNLTQFILSCIRGERSVK